MSIASEISRLQTAKSDMKSAIEGKGVTVPSSTKLDGFATLISSISGGGSANLLHGSITLDNNESAITIPVSFEPKLFMINLREMPSDNTTYRTYFEIGGFYTDTDGVPNPINTSNGFAYEFDGYPSGSRGTFLTLPVYSSGNLTLTPRSTWSKGTYDYIIAG